MLSFTIKLYLCFCTKLRPIVTPVLDGKGVKVQYKDLVKMTVESALNVASKNKSLDDAGILEMIFKDEDDGAGQQVVWKSTKYFSIWDNASQTNSQKG